MSYFELLFKLLLIFTFVTQKCGAFPIAGISTEKDKKYEIFEGDILLDNSTTYIINSLTAKNKPGTSNATIASDALIDPVRLWPKATVPFKFGNVDNSVKQAFNDAIQDFNKKTCVRFTQRTTEKNYILVVSENGCWSSIGRSGGQQELSLGRGCEYKGIAIHEMMHALGFFHEQSRLDRDSYVIIKWENIEKGFKDNFQKYPRGRAATLGEPYDYGSIMHYGSFDFSKNGKPTIIQKIRTSGIRIGQRNGFSQIDIKQVNKLYRCIEVDECALLDNGGCEHSCFNTQKSYRCYCKDGYQLYNKHKCRDIDECSLGLCDQVCKNTIGSYSCSCRSGYRLHSDRQTCEDINECLTNNGGCEHNCLNHPPGKHSCFCREGYSLKPDKKQCEDINECAQGINSCSHFCQNSLGSFRCFCRQGYDLTIDAKKCQASNCGSLAAPYGGDIKCEEGVEGHGSYQAKCNVSCAVGYKTIGSTSRTCEADRTWSGNETKCLSIRCPPFTFETSGALMIFPRSCANKVQMYNKYCVFACKAGYKMTGSKFRRCKASGLWDVAKLPLCQDVQRPTFKRHCPAKIYKTTDPQKSYATVSWLSPEAEDNSKEIRIFLQPFGLRQPHRFPMGETKITYTAIDPANNTAACSFTVSVQDQEQPKITCPRSIRMFAKRPHIKVWWLRPNVTDNSGLSVRVESSAHPGVELTYGKHVVTYRATDLSNNTATCTFNIVIAKKRCKLFPKPINGERRCDGWIYGSYCTVSCKRGYKFTTPPALLYVCGTNGHWTPNDKPPPCSV